MKSGYITIKLISNLCAATGDSIAGVVDTDIAHEYGLPIIPAKRLKGCLKETALELRDCGFVSPELLDSLFGKVGDEKAGALQIEDAHIYQITNCCEGNALITIDEYEELIEALRGQTQLNASAILNMLTSLRTRTAIDSKNGVAVNTSLRTTRVVNKNIVMRSKVYIDSDKDNGELETLLVNCVKGLRGIGLSNSRGLGEVRCKLEAMTEADRIENNKFSVTVGDEAENKENKEDVEHQEDKENQEIEVKVQLELKEPIMLAGEGGIYYSSANHISGAALLGAFAGMFIKDKKLGNDAHKNSTFSNIFLRGKVKFGYGFPVVNGKVFYPCPGSIQKAKNEKNYYNVANSKPSDKQLQSVRDFICLEDEIVHVCELNKEIRVHHSRAVDRGYGHSVGEDKGTGSSRKNPDDGDLFQYSALSAGQVFEATLRGNKKYIDVLIHCLKRRENKIQLGRSRTAEYGNVLCHFPIVKEEEIDFENVPTDNFTVCFLSPMVLQDSGTGRVVLDPQCFIKEFNKKFNCNAELQNAFLKFSDLGGYNSKWRLPKPLRPVLAGGTALVIKTSTPVIISEIEKIYWGGNTGEGCGLVKVIDNEGMTTAMKEQSLNIQTDWIIQHKRDKNKNSVIEYLKGMQSQLKEEYMDRCEAFMTDLLDINSTSIEWVLELMYQDPGYTYDTLLEEIQYVSDSSKKEKLEKFLVPCKGKSPAFIKSYFEKAKWEVRGQKNGQ